MHAVYGRDTDACTRCVAGGWTCPCYLRDGLRCIGGGLVIDRGGDSAGVFLSNQAFPTASRALCELHLPAWNRKIRYHRNIPPPWTPCGFRMPPCHDTIHRGCEWCVAWPYARWFEAGVAPRLYVGLELRDGLPCKRRSPKHCWSCAP